MVLNFLYDYGFSNIEQMNLQIPQTDIFNLYIQN